MVAECRGRDGVTARGVDKLVVLARGLGRRMREADGAAGLDERQAAAADAGLKAMMPVGRPFLDYVLGVAADAGYKNACLVVAPGAGAVRDYYAALEARRLRISFAVQVEALGTADAVLAAEDFAGGDEFAVINSDNYYPIEALGGLRGLEGPGVALFDRESLLAAGAVDAGRISAYAIAKVSEDGYLQDVVEKPDARRVASLGGGGLVSINCWRFGPAIFTACRAISRSPRGELEIPDAVRHAIRSLGERFKVVTVRAPVLDLSCRADVAAVAEKLKGRKVNL